jgi:hypothetical protein
MLLFAFPFILARYVNYDVRMTVISNLAYLALHAVSGVLVGGIVVALWPTSTSASGG